MERVSFVLGVYEIQAETQRMKAVDLRSRFLDNDRITNHFYFLNLGCMLILDD